MNLLQQLQENDWTTLVSLARNDLDLAKAAIGGGAQGLKVHINVDHFASGTHFGSFAEERNSLARIVEAAAAGDCSVGIVPGGAPFATEAEFADLAALGIDYFDAYPADAPAWTLTQPYLDKMMAAYHGVSADTMQSFERLGMQLCEASILDHRDYGKPLSALDLAHYAELATALSVPIIVPSQKKIEPTDIPALRRTGVKGVLLGAVVTGNSAASLEAALRAFVP
jgi:hypothetical protein